MRAGGSARPSLVKGVGSKRLGKGRVNPIAYGGGGLFGLCHQTVSHNSRTLSSRLPKLSDFSFLLFGHIVTKFQVN